VLHRLDRSQSDKTLSPFYTAYSDEPGRPNAPMMFSHEKDAKVFAEIEPLPFHRCGSVEMCVKGTPGGECPVSWVVSNKFESGQAVFVIKGDEEKVAERIPIPCISAVGIRVLASIHGQDTVSQHREVSINKDPWGREAGRDLIVGVDYVMIFIFDDEGLRTGICGDDSYPPALDSPADADTTTEEPSQADQQGSPSLKKSPGKKTRGGGKKKKKTV